MSYLVWVARGVVVDNEAVLALSVLLSIAHLIVDGKLIEFTDYEQQSLCLRLNRVETSTTHL